MKKLFLSIALLSSGAAIFGAASSPIKYLSQKELATILDTIIDHSDIAQRHALKGALESLQTARLLLDDEGGTEMALNIIQSIKQIPIDSRGVIEFKHDDIKKNYSEGKNFIEIKNNILGGVNPFAARPYTDLSSLPQAARVTPTVSTIRATVVAEELRSLAPPSLPSAEKFAEGIRKALSKDRVSPSGSTYLSNAVVKETLQKALEAAESGNAPGANRIIFDLQNLIMQVPSKIRSMFLKPLLDITSDIRSGTPEQFE